MPTKVAIQQERDFAGNMAQLMDIMKGLALASYVKLKKDKEKRFEKFIQSFDGFFHIVDLSKAKSPFIQTESDKTAFILVTSEESFMSGLNGKVLKMGLALGEGKKCEYLVTGKKGGARLKMEGKEFRSFPALRGRNNYDVAVQIKNYIVEKVKAKELGSVIGVFADPISFSSQQAKRVDFLPAHDVYPKSFNKDVDPNDKIYMEATVEQIMDHLVEIWITNKLYMMFQDNRMSEFAAQAMQLEGSLQNLGDLNKKLRVQYAKKRGEMIDSSLREVVTALMTTKG